MIWLTMCHGKDSWSISVTEVDDGILIENLSTVACIVVLTSPEGEQRFELGVGEKVTVTGIARRIAVAAAKL